MRTQTQIRRAWRSLVVGFAAWTMATVAVPVPNFLFDFNPAYPSGLNSWDNSIAGTENDHTVTFFIWIDRDFLLTADQAGPLTHTSTGDVLTTTYKFSTDGNGTSSSGVRSGGSYGGVPYTQQGHNTFVSASNFLTPGVVVDYATWDWFMLLRTTTRGRNAEDFGSNSDSTEAPDAGNYDAQMQLRMTWPVP